MPDYSLGKIYKIVGNGKVYVGSTCERLLCQRFAGHKSKYNKWLNGKDNYVTSFDCLSDPESYIELLELCQCSCVDELHKCEGKWIRELECVNKKIAGRTKKIYQVEWREANKEQRNEQQRVYRLKKKAEKNESI